MERFHIFYSEKYVVEHNIRQNRVIRPFFFCIPEQIQIVRQLASGFVIETDATFNTNGLQMSLSGLIGITNTMSLFLGIHYFISSESTSALVLINKCLKDLVFFDDCPRQSVTLRDFSPSLS